MITTSGNPDRRPPASSGRDGGGPAGRARTGGVTRFQVLVTLIVVIALLMLFLPLIVINHSREVAERELEEKLAQLEEDGYAVTLKEVDRRYVYPPEEDNAATLFERAHGHLEIPNSHQEDLPPWSGEEWPELGAPLPAEWDPRIRELLELNGDAIALYREAARLPEARYPADFTLGHALLIPHVGRLREAARFFSLLAVWQAGTGDWEGAASSFEILFATGRSLRNEPTLISQLTRVAITSIGIDAFERVLASGTPPPQFLVRIKSVLAEKVKDEFLMRKGVRSEMAFGVHMFDEIRRNPESFDDLLDQEDILAGILGRIYTFSESLVRDEIFYLETLKHFVDAGDEPLPGRLERFKELDETFEQRLDEQSIPGRVSTILIPSLSRIMRTEALDLARVRAAVILIALERFRGDHGRLPESLNELAPDYLDPLPDDPFSGESFGYRIEDGWAFVTSEGEMRDGPLELRLPAER